MRNLNYHDFIQSLFKNEEGISCPSITFQVTDDCCLNCSYCYQTNKGHKMMSKETMKQGIDLLFKMYDENNSDTLINHKTKGLIIEFIGGEPFMNIDVIEYGSEYFIQQCVEKDHPWLTHFRFSISSNGMLYFDEKVQAYLKKFMPFLALTITIDGPKELHDSCRKDHNGKGSYDQAILAFKDCIKYYDAPHTKITIAPENLPYLSSIVDFFIDQGCVELMANPIHEHEWTIEEAKIYYQQLKNIADKIIPLYPKISTSLFSTYYGRPMLSKDNNNWCGGTGQMLAFDPDGIAYPCIRYMNSSLHNSQPPLIIGNTQELYQTKDEQLVKEELESITRRSQSTDECFNCSVAGGCGWCSGWNYQINGTVNKRNLNLCWMNRARSLVNSYYYNKIYLIENSEKRLPIYLNREFATKIITDEEYDDLLILANNLG